MLRPEKMSFVSISVLDEHLTQVLDRLTRLGVMHIVDKTELPSGAEVLKDVEIEPLKSKLSMLDDRVEKILADLGVEGKAETALSEVDEERIEIDPFQIADKVEKELSEIESAVEPIVQKINQFQSEIRELEETSRKLHALEAEGVSIDELRRLRFLYFAFGEIPVEYYQRLIGSLARIPHVLIRGDVRVGKLQVLAFSLVSGKEVLSSALEAAYFSKTNIPERYHGPVTEVLDEIELEIWTKREEMADLYGVRRTLRQRWYGRLLELKAEIAVNQTVIESMTKFGKTDRSFNLFGWVPYKDVKKLQKELEKVTSQGVLMTASAPLTAREAENHKPNVPTKLRHPSFLRPFTGLITNFGIPRYSDIDPTLFASLSFLAMFGVMFADLGHGGVLFLLGLIGALYPLKKLSSIRQLSIFLACCGGASMIAGLLFGSLFGKEDIIKPLWFSLEHMNPESVNRMLKIGIFFGIGMLSMGVSLNIAQSFRRKNFKEAFCGQWGLFSLFSYWTALFLLLTGQRFSWDKVLIIVLLMLPIILKEPVSRLVGKKPKDTEGEEEAGESIIESSFQVYEVVMAFLANTLSYIRVAAFNLSHAGLMMAAYSLTKELGGGGNLFLSLPSDIMANVFVMMLEGLIVAIQCMRLEYYEFFSKFFAGEGIEYKPLKMS